MRVILLVISICLCTVFFSFAQKEVSSTVPLIQKVYTGKYLYNQEFFKFKNMESVFKRDPDSFVMFHKSRSKSKNAKIFGGLALGMSVGGYWYYRSLTPEIVFFTQGNALWPLLAMIVLSPIIGVISLANWGSSERYETRAVNSFNANVPLIPSTTSRLDLGVTGNGVGLVYTF